MNETSAFQEQPVTPQKTSNKKRLIVIFFIILILVIVALVTLYIIGGGSKKSPTVLTTVPTLAPQPVATATPEASSAASLTATPSAATTPTALDRTSIQVSVQNGSGVAGAAQKYATILKNAGYTNVTSANADKFTYTAITIHVAKKFSNYLPLLQKDIAKGDPSAKITASVDDTIATDAEVIVGK